MFQDMVQKDIFNQATYYAFNYLDSSFERNVYPTDKAIRDLELFEEDLPDSTGTSTEILAQLNAYGSRATVSQIGGRYFGFVNGHSSCFFSSPLNVRLLGSKHPTLRHVPPGLQA
jgi:hypothetical protein